MCIKYQDKKERKKNPKLCLNSSGFWTSLDSGDRKEDGIFHESEAEDRITRPPEIMGAQQMNYCYVFALL